MRILISNDDGVTAPGLALLADAARELSNDVLIVAPERKWTAASHQLTFDRDQTLTRIDTNAYACSGAPADCVVAAMTILHAAPALVLSGVNDKQNVGEDIAYSGTTAIAREAAFFGVPAISVSRVGSAVAQASDRDHLGSLLRMLWDRRADWALPGHWLGVNLPARLPAALVEARVGRDKIAGACDVIEATAARITYRLRRGRAGTPAPGDENAGLAQGAATVVRYRWDTSAPLAAGVVASWQAGGKMCD
ncbi:MAG TPA: 5'/3'-nucleotidase SurE [Casimicrobiaceae bacterium]|nr:5'/3'-nucleotidase SurE [Casimicrobiaceae bacterium]